MKKAFQLLPLFLFSLLVFSCGSPPQEDVNEADLLIGNWELTRAEMNGQDGTERMQGTFFHFMEEGSLQTNFNPNGEPDRYSYSIIEDGEVRVNGGFNPVFSTRFDGKDRLMLVTSINRNRFKFYLQRFEEGTEGGEEAEEDVDSPEM